MRGLLEQRPFTYMDTLHSRDTHRVLLTFAWIARVCVSVCLFKKVHLLSGSPLWKFDVVTILIRFIGERDLVFPLKRTLAVVYFYLHCMYFWPATLDT